MVKGYPDWNKPTIITAQEIENLNININAQTLERLIEAPSYGGLRAIDFDVTVDIGESKKVFEILGTGIIYGGFVHFNYEATTYMMHWFDIDGYTTSKIAIGWIFSDNLDDWVCWLLYGKRNDPNAHVSVCAFSRGITFENNYAFYFEVQPGQPEAVNVEGTVFYALR